MFGQVLYICEIACGLIAACSLLVAAWFEFRDRWQTDEEREKTRASYGKKWEAIRDSGLLQLPEKALTSALEAKTRIAEGASRRLVLVFATSMTARLWGLPLVLGAPVVGGAGVGWFTYGWIGGIALGGAPSVLCSIVVVARASTWQPPDWMRFPSMGLWAAGCLFTAGICLNMLLGLGIAYAAGAMLIVLPVYMLFLTLPLVFVAVIADNATSWGLFDRDAWGVFGTATAVSFLVTLCSLLIGNLVAPEAWIPQTLQMLLCNVAFDGFTMVATFAILARAVGEKRKYSIPLAILIDVVVAGLFACASLWLGLIGTEHALSIKQVLGVLIAKSAEGTPSYAWGPYFWAMHTTFLPTLCYLALILLFWIAKLVVLPVARVLKKGPEIDKPHSLMAGLFGFVGAAALVGVAILHVANDNPPNRSSAAPAQVAEDGAESGFPSLA